MTRTLTLKSERLTELTDDQLIGIAGANGAQATLPFLCPTVDDINRCVTLLC